MIATSRSLKMGALAVAVGLHGALAVVLIRDDPVLVEGSGSQEAQIGTSFADMAAGVLTAQETSDVIEPDAQTEDVIKVEPDKLVPAEADPVPEQPTAEQVDKAAPEDVAEARPEDVELPEPVDAPEVPQEAIALSVPETADGALAVRPESLEHTPVIPEALAALPETLRPGPTEPLVAQPVEPQETIAALNPDSTVPRLSKRPVVRDPELETPEPVREAKKKPAPRPQPQKVNRGNSTQNAKAGSTRGTAETADTRQGSGSAKSAQAGNAAVSNYPGLVNRHLSRIRKPLLNRRGVVRVSFSIGSSGGLAGVSVARSSGSPQLDQAAATMIRRAAPFPKPPAGAQRNFSINIEFR